MGSPSGSTLSPTVTDNGCPGSGVTLEPDHLLVVMVEGRMLPSQIAHADDRRTPVHGRDLDTVKARPRHIPRHSYSALRISQRPAPIRRSRTYRTFTVVRMDFNSWTDPPYGAAGGKLSSRATTTTVTRSVEPTSRQLLQSPRKAYW